MSGLNKPLKERNQFALCTIGYEGPVLNQIVKRRHAGTVRKNFACQDVVNVVEAAGFAWIASLTDAMVDVA